jgi:sodium/bile acid cotransporter 7
MTQLATTYSTPIVESSEVSLKDSSHEILQDVIRPVVSNIQEETKASNDPRHVSRVTSNGCVEGRNRDGTLGSTKLQKTVDLLKWFIRDQWFLIAMGVIILISSQVQVPYAQQRVKRTVITYLSVSVIFFVNGCTLSTKLLIENYMRWKLHAFVQLQCYLVTSAATFAIVSLCATNHDFSMVYYPSISS